MANEMWSRWHRSVEVNTVRRYSASKWHVRSAKDIKPHLNPKSALRASKSNELLQKQQLNNRQNYIAKSQRIWDWAVEGKDSASVDALFAEKRTIKAPIWNSVVPERLMPARSYVDLKHKILKNGSLAYSSKELESIMFFVATYWINSVLVELNVRKLFHDSEVRAKLPESSLVWRDQLLFNIKDPARKPELMGLLEQLVGKEYDNENSMSEALNGKELGFGIGDEFGTSEYFNSLQVLRTFYHNFILLSNYLNYPESDTIAETKSESYIRFESPTVDCTEYTSRINDAFTKFAAALDEDRNSARIELILTLAAGLLQGSHYTPSLSIFKLIMDKFGEAGLLNYQSIVLDALCTSDFHRSLLGNPAPDNIRTRYMAPQFQDLIQRHPEFLSSLLSYSAQRNDEYLFSEFLAFLRLEDTLEHEKVLRRSIYSSMLSRSRFHRPAVISAHQVVFHSDEPIMVDVNLIYEAIRIACDLKRFEYIDLLINKLLAHLVTEKKTGELKLILSYGDVNIVDNDKFQIVLGKPEMNPREFGRYVFTKELLILVLNAARSSDDVGRLMWLIPHIDDYLATAFNDSVEHLNNMEEFLKNFEESQLGSSDFEEFMAEDRKCAIDLRFVNELSRVLRILGIEGKWSTYNELLDFARVDIEQVARTNSALEVLIPQITCK